MMVEWEGDSLGAVRGAKLLGSWIAFLFLFDFQFPVEEISFDFQNSEMPKCSNVRNLAVSISIDGDTVEISSSY